MSVLSADAHTPFLKATRSYRGVSLALAASIALHALIVGLVPGLPTRLDVPLPTLEVMFAAAPVPEPQSEAPKPPAPQRVPPPRRAAVPPAPVILKEIPVPQADAAPVATVAAPAPPVAITKVEPAAIEPPREIAAVPPVSSLSRQDLLAGYGRAVSQFLQRYQEYPRMAQMRGWEGTVMMKLRIGPDGTLIEASVQQSSGHQILDQQAVAMAYKAKALPAPPEGLRDRESVFPVPVVFRLE